MDEADCDPANMSTAGTGCGMGFAKLKEETMPYYMYVALQGDDKISVFTIDPQTGEANASG